MFKPFSLSSTDRQTYTDTDATKNPNKTNCKFKLQNAYAYGNVTSAGWQVILCDPIWHVSSRSDEASGEVLHCVYLYLSFIPTVLCIVDCA